MSRLERPAKRSGSAGDQEIQLAAFSVGSEVYAVDIMRIKEIIKPMSVTTVPRSPDFIEGVIELRGAILPVVDMRKRFEFEAAALSRTSKFLIVSLEGIGQRWIVGLIVDSVSEVVRITRDQIKPAPPMSQSASARFFSGVCRHKDSLLMIVDLDQILSLDERRTLAGMADSVPSAGEAGR